MSPQAEVGPTWGAKGVTKIKPDSLGWHISIICFTVSQQAWAE